jgi:hypothetical protein
MVTAIWPLSAFGQVTTAAVPKGKEATKSVMQVTLAKTPTGSAARARCQRKGKR